TSPTVATFIPPRNESTARESRTLPPTGSRHPRKGTAGDHVVASRLAGAVIHRHARHVEYDGWEPQHAYSHPPGSRLRRGNKIFSGAQAPDDLFADSQGTQDFFRLYQSVGTDRPPKQGRIIESI